MKLSKRFSHRVPTPRQSRGVWGTVRVFVLPPLIVLGLLVGVRSLMLTQVSLPSDRPDLGLMAGDRILVNRMAYGLCLRQPGQPCSTRLGSAEPRRGDLVAYEAPGTAEGLRVGRIDGMPGDSIGYGNKGRLVPGTYRAGNDIIARERLVGRLVCVSYSLDPTKPFGQRLRRDRFFRRLP